jgi:hypothetical protein
MTSSDFIQILVSVILGGIATYYIPLALQNLRFTKRHLIVGDWHSTWQTNSASDTPWSLENVRVASHLGGIKLENLNNNNGYQWQATGTVFRDHCLVGTWRSVKPGSTSAGGFLLNVSNQGDYMVGFFLGPNRTGFLNYGAWALARDRARLDQGKAELAQMCPGMREVMGLAPTP